MPMIKEIPKEPVCKKEEQKPECKEIVPCECEKKGENPLSSIFGSMEIDDLIIIGIILLLLFEGTNDILIIALLGIILFM